MQYFGGGEVGIGRAGEGIGRSWLMKHMRRETVHFQIPSRPKRTKAALAGAAIVIRIAEGRMTGVEGVGKADISGVGKPILGLLHVSL